MKRLFIAALLMLLAPMLSAKEAAPLAEDPVTEAKLMDISKELRCLVCQNQTIADSDADLAVDLRREIRGMLKSGMDQNQIIEFMVERYGDFVRYRPPMKPTTLVLWFGPALLFVLGLTVLFINLKRRKQQVSGVSLSDEDHRRAESLLKNGVRDN